MLLTLAQRSDANQSKTSKAKTTRTKAASTAETLERPARPSSLSAAAFVAADATTQGKWGGRYGSQGYNIFGDVASYPGYAQVSRNGQAAWTWETGTNDVRALQRISATSHIAAAWYEDDALTINVNITDGSRRQVTLYLLDWEYSGRKQRVDVFNADTDALLDSRTATGFGDGQYLAWNIRGRVKFRLTRLAGANVVCSGVFFDPEALPTRSAGLPAISSVASSGITSNSASITWTTDKATDTAVEYGPSPNYGNTTSITYPLVTNHQVNLVGLAPATVYHFRVLSKDAAGNQSLSGDFAFTTAAAAVADRSDPELPRVLLDTTFPATAGRTISVFEGDNLQTALNDAAPGDTIVLQAGATYIAPSGGFVLPAKANAAGQWIVIRSSNLSALPAGQRVNPSLASAMPKIVSKDVAPGLVTAAGANFWRMAGIEITVADAALASARVATSAPNYGLVYLGSDAEADPNRLPTDIVIDRCYIHGQPTKNVRRGVALNSRRTAIIDSYFSDFHETGSDSQAVSCLNGPGPFKIVNNHLEGAGENVLFGGADPAVANLVPSDIEVRRNHLVKPRGWLPTDPNYAGINWSVKNIFELKNARRVLVEGNVLENNWVSGQNGFAVLFTVRNQDGGAPWSTVEDVTFVNNVVRHTSSAINILGRDYIHPSGQVQRLKIKNNLFEDVSNAPWGGSGRFLQLTDTVDVKVENNTIFHTGSLGVGYTNLNTPSNTGFIYRNNIAASNGSGFIGDGTGPGMDTLNAYFPGAIFVGNILAGAAAGAYPAGNYFPATLDEVGFVNRWGGDYRLAGGSPFKNQGYDGSDPGINLDALNAATSGVAP